MINLKPEYITKIDGFFVTNTLLTSIIVTIFLTFFAIYFYINRSNKDNFTVNIIRAFVADLLEFVDDVTNDRSLSKKVIPLIASFFLFIVTANLLELLPGFLGSFFVKFQGQTAPLLRTPNSDLNTTLALALFSVISIQFFSLSYLGATDYIKRFINLTSPIKFITGFFEMLSEGVKILSFSFRLFGNVFAGETLLIVTAFIIPYIIPVPFMILEVFVGVVQAFIFAMLTLTFIKTSIVEQNPGSRALQQKP